MNVAWQFIARKSDSRDPSRRVRFESGLLQINSRDKTFGRHGTTHFESARFGLAKPSHRTLRDGSLGPDSLAINCQATFM